MPESTPAPERRLITCPNCGAAGSLELRHDAWARFPILGVSIEDEFDLGAQLETEVFDDHHIQCTECGKRLSEGQVIAHIRA